MSESGEIHAAGEGLDPRAELKEAMAEFAPELRLLDCGWVLECEAESDVEMDADPSALGDLTVDWVAVDSKGRLNLLLWLGTEELSSSTEAVELALEVLQRAQTQLPYILSHLGNCGIRPELPPRLVLAATHFSASTQRKLAILGEQRMRLIEVHEVRTDSGVSHHLISRWPENEIAVPAGPEAFLNGLPEPLLVVAESILQRLHHVDERVSFGGMGEEYLEWRLRDVGLCTLQHSAGRLQAGVGEGNSLDLTDETSVEAFVEAVLLRYFEILEDEPDGAGEQGESLVDQGLNVVLSHEELDAFM